MVGANELSVSGSAYLFNRTTATAPTITNTTSDSRCGAGTVTLGATASSGVLNWYDVPTGGTSLGTGTSFITPIISTTTPYYVDITDDGITSARVHVFANILPILNPPDIQGSLSFCRGSSTTLTTTNISNATYCWQNTTAPPKWNTVGNAGFSAGQSYGHSKSLDNEQIKSRVRF